MKDSEFIELLNLYLDHEITSEDAARLEAEVQSNPARRRIYNEYCQMQKACKLLAEDFQTETAASPADHQKVVAFEAAAARRARSGNGYMVGAFVAAAACVAIVFVGHRRQAANELANQATQVAATPQTRTAPAPIVSAPVAEPSRMVATNAGSRNEANREAANTGLSLAGNMQADALLTAAMQQADTQFQWMNNVQLTPIPARMPIEQIRFDTQPASVRTPARTYGPRTSLQSDVHMIGFQFQK